LAAALVLAVPGCASSPTPQSAQAVDPDALCYGEGSVVDADLRSYVVGLPHGKAFTRLSDAEVASASSAARALLGGDIAGARTASAVIGYELVPLKTNAECLWVLRPTMTARNGQAVLVVRPQFLRDLVLEAPHIPFDPKTDEEAAIVFDAVGARAAVFAGAERCALKAPSGCGKNNACNKDDTPASSDAAHAVATAFQGFHLAAGTGAMASLVIQFHTNAHRQENGDAMITNGTDRPFAGTVTEQFFRAMGKATAADVRTCNDPAKPVLPGTLCGVTNVQGHASNGAEACNGSPSSASDRFIHVEQNQSVVDDVAKWSGAVAVAVTSVVPVR